MLKVITKAFSTYLLGSIITQLLGLVSLLLIINYLSIEQYAQYSLIINFVAIFSFLVDGGLTGYVIKELNTRKLNFGTTPFIQFYGQIQIYQLTTTMLLSLAYFFFAYVYSNSEQLWLFILFGFATLLSGVFSPIYAIYIAQGDKTKILAKDILIAVAKFLLVVVVTSKKFDYVYLYYSSIVAIAVGFIYLLPFLGSLKASSRPSHISFNLREIMGTFMSVSPFIMLSILNILYNKICILMLDKLSDTAQVAYYSGATVFIYPFMFISNALVTAVFPMLSRNANSPEVFNRIHRTSLLMLSLIGFLISVTLYCSAPLFYNNMFDGKYLSSMGTFRILVWYLFIVFSYAVLSNSIVARNGIKVLIVINAIMVLINIVLNFVLIPIFGASGAAFSTVTCELLILIYMLLYHRKISKQASYSV